MKYHCRCNLCIFKFAGECMFGDKIELDDKGMCKNMILLQLSDKKIEEIRLQMSLEKTYGLSK